MARNRFGSICPISHACKILEPRWTIPIVCELWAGATRFNEIRRGVGNISPGLLSKRLKELESNGMIYREVDGATETVSYFRTQKAIALEPALNALGVWAQQNIDAEIALCDTDVTALMRKLWREIDADCLPNRRFIMRFHFSDAHLKHDTFWLVFYPNGERDLCSKAPNHDVDLYVETDLVTIGAVLTNRMTLAKAREAGALFLSGDPAVAHNVADWLPYSCYADVEDVLPFSGERLTAAE